MECNMTTTQRKIFNGVQTNRVYYPSKQLYGGYVFSKNNYARNALIIQNSAVLYDALVTDDSVIYGNAIIGSGVEIAGNSRIGGDVVLEGKYRISGNAKIESYDDFIVIGPIGSRKANVVFHRLISPGMWGVTCGCYTGTLKEFSERVHRVYKEGSLYRMQYDAAIDFARKALKM